MTAFDYDSVDLSALPPETEPARQRYFIARLRQYTAREEKRRGRKLTFCVATFGCQMNAHDSEKLRGILKESGFAESESEQADFVLYNTCTVRENADQRVYGRLGRIGSFRKQNPDMMIALCGCMMQEEHVREKLRKSYPFVDIIFGNMNNYKLAELLAERIDSGKQVIDIIRGSRKIVEDLPADHKYSFKSGLNIMYGCNNFCSYCIVPYVTGREQSRTPEDILAEARNLAANGVVEIMLLGQNVNSYGKTLEHPVTFAELLRRVEQIEGIRRIRFMTSHPKDLSDELIDVMKHSEKICRHLHLPLQSGSTRILEAMNRHYTKEQYLALAEKIRREIPDLALTTDIIVGFPGETEEDFLETIDVVRRVHFDGAFTFIYSRRSGTPAASMENQVPADVVKDRFDRLLAVVQEEASAMCDKGEGSVREVLVEGKDDHEEGWLSGRLSNNMLVHFEGNENLIGSTVNVRLAESKGFYYIGTLSPIAI
ncbi:MAG: tRNA (N6-isopentenyl adenosine(37)-C2)-methylthiotransferase MiaB [Clostridium sp.]|nr:tRNA (N6-isopentenyl adenosine(37)-C2)-methylthiotransferase MiaB [Clostridium sp.]